MSQREARLRRRRARARKIVRDWISLEGNGYDVLESAIVEAQNDTESDVLSGCCHADAKGRIFCEYGAQAQQIRAERDVALNFASEIQEVLQMLVTQLEAGFVPDEAVHAYRRAKRLLESHP